MTQFNTLQLGTAYNVGRSQNGAYIAPVASWSVIPAASNSTNIATAQTISGTAFTLTAGTGVTSVTIGGQTYLDLGCQRALLFSALSGATTTTLTVTGMQEVVNSAGVAGPSYIVVENLTSPNGATGAATVTTAKTYRYIRTISAAGNTTTNISIGTADVFGLPWAAKTFGDVQAYWNSALVTSTGFTAADLSTPTATTGDTRGKITPPSAADGTRELVTYVRMRDLNSAVQTYGQVPFSG